MSNRAFVFDWDGTLVSCEEKIDGAIDALSHDFPLAVRSCRQKAARGAASPGWIKRGFVASLPEDYFSYYFGMLSQELAESAGIDGDAAWKLVLTYFRQQYKHYRSRLLVQPDSLARLSRVGDVFVVSNSQPDNVAHEAELHGLDMQRVQLVGNARKYRVVSNDPSVMSISANRPEYILLLQQITERFDDVTVIGDNFSLDLATPLYLGLKVAYVPNQFTPPSVYGYLARHGIEFGPIAEIFNSFY